jgi:hypothetical protein
MSARIDRPGEEGELQQELRDLICLAVVADHVRWVLTDDDEFGEWLADAAAQWREWADRVATQLAASRVAPDGRVRSLVRDIPWNWVPDGWLTGEKGRRLIAQRLALVAEWASYRHSEAEGTDRELFDLVATGLQAQLRDLRKRGTATQTANAEATTPRVHTTKSQTARAANSPTIAP